MKTLLLVLVTLTLSAPAFAVTASDISAGDAELERACNQPGVDRTGSTAAHECIAAFQRVQENSHRLNRDIADHMEERDQERQRIQQDEMWRQQIRNQNR